MAELTDSKEKATKEMSLLGIIFLVFAGWGLGDAIFGLIDMNSLIKQAMSMSAVQTTLTGAEGIDVEGIIRGVFIAIVVIAIIVCLIEAYFGYIAYKGKPTKFAAVVCLIVGILTLLGMVSTLAESGLSQWWIAVQSLCSGILAIMYFYYYKKMNA